MTGQKKCLVIYVDDGAIFRDGEIFNLVNDPSFLGEGSIFDYGRTQKLELLEGLIRERRMFLEQFKSHIPNGV